MQHRRTLIGGHIAVDGRPTVKMLVPTDLDVLPLEVRLTRDTPNIRVVVRADALGPLVRAKRESAVHELRSGVADGREPSAGTVAAVLRSVQLGQQVADRLDGRQDVGGRVVTLPAVAEEQLAEFGFIVLHRGLHRRKYE